MTARWDRVTSVFYAARTLDSDARSSFLALACRGDDGLRAEVEALLAGDAESAGFLEDAPWARLLPAVDTPDLKDQIQNGLSGAYTIERELSGAGMSRVFLAEDAQLKRKVVVKVLPEEMSHGVSSERFRREIALAAALQHPNIVPVLSAGVAGGLPYYTMPYIDGESLRHRLATGDALPIGEVVPILREIARALAHAHGRGVVHRDIKPENILMAAGAPVVTDFGIAKALVASGSTANAELTATGVSIGTLAYMPPEQIAGDPSIDHRADIYAFGVLAYELLAGRTPFFDRTPRELAAAHLTERPKFVSDLRAEVPVELANLVARCLEKNPTARPASADEILRVLDRDVLGNFGREPPTFRRAIIAYVVACLLVGSAAWLATGFIGLPDWVVPGAALVMAAGLPVVLATGYVQWAARRALSASSRTPKGTLKRGTLATLAVRASPHLSWGRTKNGGLIAVAGLAAAVALFMVTRALGLGPAASLFAAGRLNVRDPIIVADFDVSRTDSSVGSVVAEAIRTSLSESPTIRLASMTAITNTLRLMQKPPTARLDFAVARDIAQRLGLKAIVTGTVTGLGSSYVIALRLVTTDSGSMLATYETTADAAKNVIDAADAVAKKLRGKIGESLRSVQSTPRLENLTTSSIEALRFYSLGSRLNGIGDYAGALVNLRRATAIDTTFAEGWRKVAAAEVNLNMPQSSIDSAMERAFRNRGRLPAAEALQIEAYRAGTGVGRDRAKAYAIYTDLLGRTSAGVSTDYPIVANLGQVDLSRRDFAAAETVLRSGDRTSLRATHLIEALTQQGKFAAAQSLADSARRQYPGAGILLLAQWRLYGNVSLDAVELFADSIRTISNDGRRYAAMAMARVLATRGELRRSLQLSEERARSDSTAGLLVRTFLFSTRGEVAEIPPITTATLIGAVRGDTAAATRLLDSAVARGSWNVMATEDRPYASYALAYARIGRPDRARALLARMNAEVRDSAVLHWWQPVIQESLGQIAFDEGRAREALNQFRASDRLPDGPVQADALPMLVNVARAFDLANERDSAVVYFERYLVTPSHLRGLDDCIYLASVYRRLGELYEANGANAKAVASYQKLIELWRNADPELQPVVSDIKRRIARLHHLNG